MAGSSSLAICMVIFHFSHLNRYVMLSHFMVLVCIFLSGWRCWASFQLFFLPSVLSFLVKCLSKPKLFHCLIVLMLSFKSSLMQSGCKSFIRFMVYRDILLVCVMSFHLNIVLYRANILKFEDYLYFNFFFCRLCFCI